MFRDWEKMHTFDRFVIVFYHNQFHLFKKINLEHSAKIDELCDVFNLYRIVFETESFHFIFVLAKIFWLTQTRLHERTNEIRCDDCLVFRCFKKIVHVKKLALNDISDIDAFDIYLNVFKLKNFACKYRHKKVNERIKSFVNKLRKKSKWRLWFETWKKKSLKNLTRVLFQTLIWWWI